MSQDYIPLEQLLGASDGSVYKLAVLGARRALQLADGEKPLIEKPSEKALENALKEIALKRIRVGAKFVKKK